MSRAKEIKGTALLVPQSSIFPSNHLMQMCKKLFLCAHSRCFKANQNWGKDKCEKLPDCPVREISATLNALVAGDSSKSLIKQNAQYIGYDPFCHQFYTEQFLLLTNCLQQTWDIFLRGFNRSVYEKTHGSKEKECMCQCWEPDNIQKASE